MRFHIYIYTFFNPVRSACERNMSLRITKVDITLSLSVSKASPLDGEKLLRIPDHTAPEHCEHEQVVYVFLCVLEQLLYSVFRPPDPKVNCVCVYIYTQCRFQEMGLLVRIG